jgi:hypothetical protein
MKHWETWLLLPLSLVTSCASVVSREAPWSERELLAFKVEQFRPDGTASRGWLALGPDCSRRDWNVAVVVLEPGTPESARVLLRMDELAGDVSILGRLGREALLVHDGLHLITLSLNDGAAQFVLDGAQITSVHELGEHALRFLARRPGRDIASQLYEWDLATEPDPKSLDPGSNLLAHIGSSRQGHWYRSANQQLVCIDSRGLRVGEFQLPDTTSVGASFSVSPHGELVAIAEPRQPLNSWDMRVIRMRDGELVHEDFGDRAAWGFNAGEIEMRWPTDTVFHAFPRGDLMPIDLSETDAQAAAAREALKRTLFEPYPIVETVALNERFLLRDRELLLARSGCVAVCDVYPVEDSLISPSGRWAAARWIGGKGQSWREHLTIVDGDTSEVYCLSNLQVPQLRWLPAVSP